MSDKSKDWQKFREENAHLDDVQDEIDEDEDEDEEGGGSGVATAELEHPSYEALESKLTVAEQQAYQYRDQATRAMAELENVRRRAERDVAQAHLYSLEKFVKEIIPVIDSLEQALQLVDVHAEQAMHDGLSLTMKLFLSVIAKFQVEQLDPMGELFNPQEQEAMSMQESDAPPSTVVMVFQKGYKLNDRLIRPARVIVSK
ncbi:MAG: nucleotide exchange factor GrpE [Legionellales bacterium]|nr:nucleotide exchange factor GrpE [Legionellales bacterium]